MHANAILTNASCCSSVLRNETTIETYAQTHTYRTHIGSIAESVLDDKSRAIELYSLALNVDGDVDESDLLRAFRTVMPLVIATIGPDEGMRSFEMIDDRQYESTTSTTSASSDSRTDQRRRRPRVGSNARLAFDLCDSMEGRCPTQSDVDGYRGAAYLALGRPEVAHRSYRRSLAKAARNASIGKDAMDRGEYTDEGLALLADFVDKSTLASASARKAGMDHRRQMEFLEVAEGMAASHYEYASGGGSGNAMPDVSERALECLRDRMVELYNQRGIAEKAAGSDARAIESFERALRMNPTDGHSLVQLASVGAAPTGVRELDPEYVSSLFDGYSSRFESDLVDTLRYRGHVLLYEGMRAALDRLGVSSRSVKRVVDLGCGTGLLGGVVANGMPWVELRGVDLSGKMVDIARGKERVDSGRPVYAAVSRGDAAEYLSSLHPRSVDCILASDVMIYVGDMSGVLEGSSRCLATDGLLGFTVEGYEGANAELDGGLRLLPSGRFGHSRSHVSGIAKSHGFEVLSWDDCILRQQRNADVNGAIVILRKISVAA